MTDSDSHSRPPVQLQIINVTKRSSGMVSTTRYTYEENEGRKSKQSPGAEWEEIEFALVQEEKPTIQISNVVGSALLVNNVAKLIINDPDLFGKYKVGDIIDFTPSGNIQPTPRDMETPNQLNGSYCPECGLPQWDTPSGPVCKQGHGGLQGISKPN